MRRNPIHIYIYMYICLHIYIYMCISLSPRLPLKPHISLKWTVDKTLYGDPRSRTLQGDERNLSGKIHKGIKSLEIGLL